MIAAGILRDGEPIELIDGLLVRKDRGPEGNPMVISTEHSLVVTRLGQLDRSVEPFGHHVRVQQPVTLSATSEPEPDASVVRGAATDYSARHPGPEDVAVAIEVAESSLHYDRTTKLRLYAATGVPTYWIVNLPDRQMEAFRVPIPQEERYAHSAVFKRGESVRLELGAQAIEVAVSSILPPDA